MSLCLQHSLLGQNGDRCEARQRSRDRPELGTVGHTCTQSIREVEAEAA